MLGLWWKQIATFLLSLLLLTVPNPSTALSSNGQSKAPDSYVSVRALDHYGNAVQLSHAKEAARRYGRPVVVAVVQALTSEGTNNSTEAKSATKALFDGAPLNSVRSSTLKSVGVRLCFCINVHPFSLFPSACVKRDEKLSHTNTHAHMCACAADCGPLFCCRCLQMHHR